MSIIPIQFPPFSIWTYSFHSSMFWSSSFHLQRWCYWSSEGDWCSGSSHWLSSLWMGFNTWQKLQFFVYSKGLSLYFMCSDLHVKYRTPRGFPLTSSLLSDCHIHTPTHSPYVFLHFIFLLYKFFSLQPSLCHHRCARQMAERIVG